MFHQRKVNLRHAAVYVAAMFIIMVVLPYACIKIFPGIVSPQPGPAVYHGSIPKEVRVYMTKEKEYRTIPFEEYVQGVVASEMPASFETEALKAQAVASRTYALGRIHAGSEICDSVHCQVYRADDISRKVKKAVSATSGQVLLYNGKLASHALYFSSSAGPTENSQDVFSGSFAYLVSVDSSHEPGATHKKEVETMSIAAFAKKIKKTYPDMNFGAIKKTNIKILSRSEGGRVKKMKVGSKTLSGAEVRTALGLYSARFKISFTGNKKITFTTAGSGHGVGMSQYGANGLAEKGEDYRAILSHYYQGTAVGAKK